MKARVKKTTAPAIGMNLLRVRVASRACFESTRAFGGSADCRKVSPRCTNSCCLQRMREMFGRETFAPSCTRKLRRRWHLRSLATRLTIPNAVGTIDVVWIRQSLILAERCRHSLSAHPRIFPRSNPASFPSSARAKIAPDAIFCG